MLRYINIYLLIEDKLVRINAGLYGYEYFHFIHGIKHLNFNTYVGLFKPYGRIRPQSTKNAALFRLVFGRVSISSALSTNICFRRQSWFLYFKNRDFIYFHSSLTVYFVFGNLELNKLELHGKASIISLEKVKRTAWKPGTTCKSLIRQTCTFTIEE